MAETDHAERIAGRRRALQAHCAGMAGAEADLVLEIGSGHGHFLIAYARVHPRQTCVGVDFNLERVERSERKRRRADLPNVRFIRADAGDFLAAAPSTLRFAAVFILFPDPWPKRRHHKNRLMRPEFLSELAGRTRAGGRLYFRTDHPGYFAAAVHAVREAPEWRLLEESWPFDTDTIFSARAAQHHSLVAERR